jgi:hypothetical protein
MSALYKHKIKQNKKKREVKIMYNTIILLKGEATLTMAEYKSFENMDTIYGDGSNPEELMRWSIDEEAEALEKLKGCRCSYIRSEQLMYIEEYALMYCECDKSGEFIAGADFEPAKPSIDVTALTEANLMWSWDNNDDGTDDLEFNIDGKRVWLRRAQFMEDVEITEDYWTDETIAYAIECGAKIEVEEDE